MEQETSQQSLPLEEEPKKKSFLSISSSCAKYVGASAVFIFGFILSPLTWWNDLVVNLPIAWVVASIFPETWFKQAVIIAYWFTNIAGLLLMHFSGNTMINKKIEPLTWKSFWESTAWATLYSLLFWILMSLKIIQPIDLTAIKEMLGR